MRVACAVCLLVVAACGPRITRLAPPPGIDGQPATADGASAQSRAAALRGELALARGDHSLAVAALGEAVLLDPGSAWLRRRLGRVHLERGELELAREHLEEATRRDPACGLCWLDLARVVRFSGDQVEAARHYERAAATGGGWRARAGGIDVLLDLGGDEQRLRAETLLDAWPEPPLSQSRALAERGRRAHTLGRTEAAFGDLERYLSRHPADSGVLELFVSLGRALDRRWSTREALRRAVAASPGRELAPRLLARWCQELGDRPGELRALERLARLSGSSSPVDLERRIVLHRELGEVARADVLLALLRERDPRHPRLSELAELPAAVPLVSAGQAWRARVETDGLSAAAEAARARLADRPDDPWAQLVLAEEALASSSSVDEVRGLGAGRYVQAAREGHPIDPWVSDIVARVLLQQGKVRDALVLLEDASRLHPLDSQLRQRLHEAQAAASRGPR